MNKNNNYFSDVTDLFLKAKNEEKIKIDPKSKAEIRSTLTNKIAELKGVPEDTTAETHTGSSFANFWNRYKYQFLGVPATVFAIMAIVYAANNIMFTIPKEDYSPKGSQNSQESQLAPENQDTQKNQNERNEPESPPEQARKAENEQDEPVFETLPEGEIKEPELLVLDINEMGSKEETRRLNKLPEKEPEEIMTGGGELPENETQNLKDNVKSEQQTEEPEKQQTEEQQSPDETSETKETKDEKSAQKITATRSDDEADQPKQDQPETENQTLEQTQPEPDEPADELQTQETAADDKPQELKVLTPQERNPSLATNTGEKTVSLESLYTSKPAEPVKTVNDEVAVNYYLAPEVEVSPEFDGEILKEITGDFKSGIANVYYLSEEKVVVKVQQDDASKYYLYEKNESGEWTTRKYEKQLSYVMLK
jgi:hypothetical protein